MIDKYKGGLFVRRADSKDFDAVSRFQEEFWHTAFPGLAIVPMPPCPEGIARRRRVWDALHERQSGCLLVLEDGEGTLAGFSHFDPRQPDLLPYESEIQAMHVHPSLQAGGDGVALLLRAMLDNIRALGFDNVLIWALEDDRRVRSLYETEGGREIGRKVYEFGGFSAPEIAYGWEGLQARRGAR